MKEHYGIEVGVSAVQAITALAAGLPSGEIEGAHRYVFHSRLKIAGGWRKTEKLKKMIALRVLRANGG